MTVPQPTHILYQWLYSSASLRVRYSFAIRGPAKSPADEMTIEEKSINIGPGGDEQFSEWYLCNINKNGEVPVLVPVGDDGKPMPESLDITYRIAASYPDLMPAGLDVKSHLEELHKISLFAISFHDKKPAISARIAGMEGRLKGEISKTYRIALQDKLARYRKMAEDVTKGEGLETAVSRARKVIAKAEEMLEKSSTPWIFGTDRPTAYDAHLVVTLLRLQDMDQGDIINMRVNQFLEYAISQPEWQSVAQGRRTWPGK